VFWCPDCSCALGAIPSANVEGVTPGLGCPECGKNFPLKNGFYVFDESELVSSLDYHLDKAKLDTESNELLNKLGRYLIPNLGGIKGSRILSVGCGSGSDIKELNDLGAEAYGMDFAYRTEGWKTNGFASEKDHLFVSSAAKIPFPREFFDVVLCMGVIEHVVEELVSKKDYPELDRQRGLFLKTLFGMLKPGGTLIITSPNRNFPIDFQHNAYGSPKVLAKLSVYTHSPFTRFLESYYSLSRHFGRIGKHKAEPMPLVNFFGFNVFELSSRLSGFKRIFEAYIRALDSCPQFVRRSFLNPYVVLKIVKESARC
jgi:2-polyprenyl-3-methyl-5-hydroxy-6-metoxy-1,4-benzoquinol methylase/uncharacterized protein YbaR (Trm112 family)